MRFAFRRTLGDRLAEAQLRGIVIDSVASFGLGTEELLLEPSQLLLELFPASMFGEHKLDQLVATGPGEIFLRHCSFLHYAVPSSKRYAI